MASKKVTAEAKATTKKRKAQEIAPEETPAEAPAAPASEEAKEPQLYTAQEVNAILADMKTQMEALKAQLAAQTAPVSIVAAPQEEKVSFRWQAPVADENVLEIGQNGRWATITGKTGAFSVPKGELGNVLTPMIRRMIDRRWLIVLGGLDEAEQEALGVRYRAGEILDKAAFSNLLKLGDKIVSVYRDLCPGNREIVEKLIYEQWCKSRKAKRELMEALNQAAKECGNAENAFRKILQEMNEEAAE